LNVPGSPSAALQTTYLVGQGWDRIACHFVAVGKPAPPRPRKPERRISAITASGPDERADDSADPPPRAR
jgi:hypothetical protein